MDHAIIEDGEAKYHIFFVWLGILGADIFFFFFFFEDVRSNIYAMPQNNMQCHANKSA